MKKIEVSAAIIKKEKEILITKRSGGPFHDKWEFPGGKIEKNESRENAVIREIKEELEVDIQVDSFLTTIQYQYPQFHLTMHTFWCTITKGDLVLTEHSEAKWVKEKDLLDVDWIPADIDVINAIIDSKVLR